jgi:DNA-binding CsgD family transcriptional regulator
MLDTTAPDLSRAVELFYEASVTPATWPDALGELALAVNAHGAMLTQFGEAAVVLPCSRSLDNFAAHYVNSGSHAEDQLTKRSVERKLVNGFYPSSDVYSDEEGQQDPHLAVRAEQFGLGPFAFSHFWGLIGETVTLRIYRKHDEPGFTNEECQALNTVFAHFRRAISLSVQLGLSRGAGLLDGLSTVKCGAALLDSRGHLHKTNALADRILDRYAAPHNGRLVVSDGKAQARLDGQIIDAIDGRDDNDSDHGDFVVVRQSHRNQPLIIQVIPVRSHEDVFRSVRAIVLFNDLNLEQGLRSDLLTAVLDLRPSEARVASLLAQGRSLDDIGDELELRRETVRSYVKNILSKARVNKQSAFVAIAARMGSVRGANGSLSDGAK